MDDAESYAVEHNVEELFGGLSTYELRHVPDILFMSGDDSLLHHGKRVAVVGSRKPSENGQARARAVAKKLVDLEITVVSGLALGVDTIAHTSAIENGGRTIAVLGAALDNPYPKRNRLLFEKIAEKHLAISQFPSGHPILGENFPRRNRTMAFISDATIIIEASEKSGTRHQGWEALRIGRQLYLLESVATDKSLTWPSEMIKYGARVLTQSNFEDEFLSLDNVSGIVDASF